VASDTQAGHAGLESAVLVYFSLTACPTRWAPASTDAGADTGLPPDELGPAD